MRGSAPACGTWPSDRLLRVLGLHRLLDELRLVDRELRRGRRALLERARGEEPSEAAEQEQHAGDEEVAPEDRVRRGRQQVVRQPREAVQHEQQADEREDAGDDADDGAADQDGELLRDLGLGELDLLAHEDLRAVGDLLDRLRDVRGRRLRALLAGAHLLGADRHAQSPPSRWRMNAATSPPANAAPTRYSGRSSGIPKGSPDDDSSGAADPAGRAGEDATTVTVGVGSGVGPAVVGLWRSSLIRADPPRTRGAR